MDFHARIASARFFGRNIGVERGVIDLPVASAGGRSNAHATVMILGATHAASERGRGGGGRQEVYNLAIIEKTQIMACGMLGQ